jgi:AAA family ATP:ADP antiporter
MTDVDAHPFGSIPLDRPSPLERLLRIVSDVRPGEGVASGSMLASVFLLLAANYFIKPARDGLLAVSELPGLSEMELKAYTSFGQSLLLLGVVPLYCRLAARWPRRRFIERVGLFVAANLVVFWALQPGLFVERMPYLGIVFYLWSGIFNVLVVAQFWSFAADLYTGEGGLRLFPAIALGATAGSAVGAWLAKMFVRSEILGTYSLLLVAAALLVAAVRLMRFAESCQTVDETFTTPPCSASSAERADSGALRLLLRHRYLLATAVVILLVNWVKTNSDNLLFSIVQEVLQNEVAARGFTDPAAVDQFIRDQTTAFYGDFFFWVNLFGFLLQALLVSRVLKYGGFAALLLALPMISLVAYPLLAWLPMLSLFRIAKIAEDSTNYSLNNTAVQVLWLPTTREMKYKGKAAVDTIFVRLGDGLAALTTFTGVHVLLFPVNAFFALNALLAAAWFVLALVVVTDNRRLVRASGSETSATVA